MVKINATLKALLETSSEKDFPVIIVVNDIADVQTLKIIGGSVIMPGILSAKLSKKDILRLAKNRHVLNIDLDQEMEIL